MRVAIAAALAVTTVFAGLVACTDEAPATTAGMDGGRDSGATSSGGGEDTGGKRAPTGCLLRTTGFMIGDKTENVARTDVQNTVDWSNLDGALSEDGKFATVTLSEGQESSTLRVSDFDFAIPEAAETWGIEVELKRRAPDGGVEDARIDVEIESKSTRFKLVDGPWPTSIVGTHAYGQAVDTWGADVSPSDFNKASFAAKLAVKRADGSAGPATALVESLRVAIHFCPEPVKK
ncbi:MAG TPA: hypothetical protein VM925_18455 [Labilithrix sp.]|nr:hypothetical protein [Labilithrix sp.]